MHLIILIETFIIIILTAHMLFNTYHSNKEKKLKNFQKELEITNWPSQLKSVRDWGKIDKSIIPLINILNRYGIKTGSSCSGHGKEDGYVDIVPVSYIVEYDDIGKQFVLLKINKNKVKKIEKQLGEEELI